MALTFKVDPNTLEFEFLGPVERAELKALCIGILNDKVNLRQLRSHPIFEAWVPAAIHSLSGTPPFVRGIVIDETPTLFYAKAMGYFVREQVPGDLARVRCVTKDPKLSTLVDYWADIRTSPKAGVYDLEGTYLGLFPLNYFEDVPI